MQTCHASSAAASATGIERTSKIAHSHVTKKAIQSSFKYRLQTTQHKIATRGGIDDERKVVRE